jgi:hypothetical protein
MPPLQPPRLAVERAKTRNVQGSLRGVYRRITSPAREFPGRSHLPRRGAVCGELQRRFYYQPPTPNSQRPRNGRAKERAEGANEFVRVVSMALLESVPRFIRRVVSGRFACGAAENQYLDLVE